MPVGEVIALLTKFASSFDGDDLLMIKSIYSIDVDADGVNIYFEDGNTDDYRITKDGRKEMLHE